MPRRPSHRLMLLFTLLCGFAPPLFAAAPPPQPASAPVSQPGASLTREKAAQFIATCEHVWFQQGYLYHLLGGHYASLQDIQHPATFMHGYHLLVMSETRQIDESLIDSKDNPARQWRRQHEAVFFDGRRRTEWTDYDNEAIATDGGRAVMLQDPGALYAFYGFLNNRPLSQLIRQAQEFYFAPQLETVGGEPCAIANCVFKSKDHAGQQITRYELALAVNGALFPMRIQRFIDRGDGEKRTSLWEAQQVDKDPARHIWQLRVGQFVNLGTQSVYQLEVINRRELKPEQQTDQAFTLAMPRDVQLIVATSQPAASQPASEPASQKTKALASKKTPHLEISFLPSFMGLKMSDLAQKLDGTYKNGFQPAWGNELNIHVTSAPASWAASKPAGKRK